MPVFLRFLIIASLLAIGGLAAYDWLVLPSQTTKSTIYMIEKSDSGIARAYIDIVWKKYRSVIVPLASDPSQLNGRPEAAKFAEETAQYFEASPVVRVNIYTASGQLLLKIDGNIKDKLTGQEASPDALFVAHHITDSAAGQLLPQVPTQSGHAAMVQVVVPIRAPDKVTSEGAVEIVSLMPDLPNEVARDEQYAFEGMGAMAILLLLAAFLSMFLVIRRSEAIITRQHEENIELMEAVSTAQAASRDKSQFLANVSHELRTPLNAIIGFSEILKNEVSSHLPDKKYMNYITDINASGIHLLSLINDILDYSKAEAGKLDLELSEINATKLVQNSVRLVSPRAEAGHVRLVELLAKEQFPMVTDSKKFKQVLLNLLSNAVKFTPAGGTVTINAWQNVADDTITFEVRDNGIGIAPKDISRAMMPFGQVDNTLRRKYEGTGLGLPLTKRFVELMGGKFVIESEVGKGTRIAFTLPRIVTLRDGMAVKVAG